MADHHRAGGLARAKAFTREYQSRAGKALVEKRGVEWMRKIGKAGFKKVRHLYKKVPYGQSGWALVNKKTGEVVATWQ